MSLASDKAEAARLFREAVATGADPADIIAAAKRYAVEVASNRAQFIPAAIWLQERRWENHQHTTTINNLERNDQ